MKTMIGGGRMEVPDPRGLNQLGRSDRTTSNAVRDWVSMICSRVSTSRDGVEELFSTRVPVLHAPAMIATMTAMVRKRQRIIRLGSLGVEKTSKP
jgi:hypothetical protein